MHPKFVVPPEAFPFDTHPGIIVDNGRSFGLGDLESTMFQIEGASLAQFETVRDWVRSRTDRESMDLASHQGAFDFYVYPKICFQYDENGKYEDTIDYDNSHTVIVFSIDDERMAVEFKLAFSDQFIEP